MFSDPRKGWMSGSKRARKVGEGLGSVSTALSVLKVTSANCFLGRWPSCHALNMVFNIGEHKAYFLPDLNAAKTTSFSVFFLFCFFHFVVVRCICLLQ